MIDLVFTRKVSGLRRLKWLCTLTASVALMIAGGVTINAQAAWTVTNWSTVPIALAVAGIALAVRYAIALRLDDKRSSRASAAARGSASGSGAIAYFRPCALHHCAAISSRPR